MFWNQMYWTDETKLALSQNDGKQKVWRRKERKKETPEDAKLPHHV